MDIYQSVCADLDTNSIKKNVGFISAAAANHSIFQNQTPEQLDGHIKEIHGLLNNGKTRERGVRLLLDVVGQCSQQTYQSQGERWFRLCSQAVSSARNGQKKMEACMVILNLLRSLPFIPDLQRTITSRSPAPLIIVLASAGPAWNCTALECLCEYLKVAPGPCLPHKATLEKQMFRYLDAPLSQGWGRSGRGVWWAGQVYAALPLPGKGGPGSLVHSEARARLLTSLLALAHSLMDRLFEGIIENEAYDHMRQHGLNLESKENVEYPLERLFHMVTRLANTLTFISAFITSVIVPVLTVTPQELLSVIFRLLQFEMSVLRKYRGQEHKLVAFLMPVLQQHALLLLQDLLYSVGEAVDLYWGPILNLLEVVIKANSGSQDQISGCMGGERTRAVAYSTLDTLLQVSKGRHPPSTALVKIIALDFTPRPQHVTLQKRGSIGSGLVVAVKGKKKKGYKLATRDPNATTATVLNSTQRQEEHSRLTYTALTLAKNILSHTAHSLHSKTYQELQSGLLSVASCVMGLPHCRRPSLYSRSPTRAALIAALSALATSPNPYWPPPYTMLIHLFSQGLGDETIEVSSASQASLDSVRILAANPQVTPLSHTTCTHHSHHHMEEDEDTELEEPNYPDESNSREAEDDEKSKAMESEEEGGKKENGIEEESVEEEEEGDSEGESEGSASPVCGREQSFIGVEVEEEEEEEKQEEEEEDDDSPVIQDEVTPESSKYKKNGRNKKSKHTKKAVESQPTSESGKRTLPDKTLARSEERKKKMKKTGEEESNGPSVEEMMSTFVDADPDDEN